MDLQSPQRASIIYLGCAHLIAFTGSTGKAGSGKSTLMKFIQGHSKTQELLYQWGSKSRPYHSNSLFFGALEHPCQKSQVGLFRTLLFPNLSPIARKLFPRSFPNRWRSRSIGTLESWTRAELLAAFYRGWLVYPRLRDKICLFRGWARTSTMGDHPELINVFRLLAQSPGSQDFAYPVGLGKMSLTPLVCLNGRCTFKNLRRMTYDSM